MRDEDFGKIGSIHIKEGFYQLPLVQNITNKPEYPYQYGYQGAIHSNYLTQILNILISATSFETKKKDFSKLLHGHALDGLFAELDFERIVDYFRHFLHLNRDELGWETVDQVLKQFETISPARWDLPGNRMDQAFREGLLAIFEWKSSPEEREIIIEFIKDVQEFSSEDIAENKEFQEIIVNLDKTIWNVRVLYTLYETLNLMVYQYNAVEEEKYANLIKRIEDVFEAILDQINIPLESKITIGLLYVNALLRKKKEDLVSAKRRLEDMWEQFRRRGEGVSEEFQWVYGSVYVKIVSTLYDFEREVVTRRMLLRDILDNYIKPDMIKYRRWRAHLLQTKPHPLLFSLLTTGYGSMLNTIKEHIMDLPPKQDKDILLSIHKNLSSFTFDFITQYLDVVDDKNEEQPQLGYRIVSVISNLKLPPGSLQELQVAIHLAIKNNIIHSRDMAENVREELLETGFLVSERLFSNRFSVLFRADIELSFNMLPFQSLVKEIIDESQKFNSLLHSHTFEEEVINRFASMFGFVKNRLHVSLELERYFYEVMLWFLSEWYWNLVTMDEIRSEVNIILPPFIGIMMQRLAIYYMERNQPTKAQLMLINHYFFIQISEKGGRRLEKLAKEGPVNRVLEELYEMYEELDVQINPQEFNLKKMASLDLSAKQASTIETAEEDVPLSLSDELFVTYLDLSDNLDKLLQQTEQADQKAMRRIIIDNDLFVPPVDFSIDILEKIGKCSPMEVIKQYPFPLIRNLNSMAIAIQLFPMNTNYPEFDLGEMY